MFFFFHLFIAKKYPRGLGLTGEQIEALKKSSPMKVTFNKVTYNLTKNRADCFKFSFSANIRFAFLPVLPNTSICSVRSAERYWRGAWCFIFFVLASIGTFISSEVCYIQSKGETELISDDYMPAIMTFHDL